MGEGGEIGIGFADSNARMIRLLLVEFDKVFPV